MGLRPKAVCLFNCRLIHAYLSASSFSRALLIATLKTGTCGERYHMKFSHYILDGAELLTDTLCIWLISICLLLAAKRSSSPALLRLDRF